MSIILIIVTCILGLAILGAIIQLATDGFKFIEFMNFLLICFLFGFILYILRHGGITLK